MQCSFPTSGVDSKTFLTMRIRFLRYENPYTLCFFFDSCPISNIWNLIFFLMHQAMIVRGFRGDSESHKIYFLSDSSFGKEDLISLFCLVVVTVAAILSDYFLVWHEQNSTVMVMVITKFLDENPGVVFSQTLSASDSEHTWQHEEDTNRG